MSLVAQCLQGSGPVPRSKSRFRLKARENKSSELRAAHIASVHASAGPSTPPGKQREERRAEWKTQRRQVRTGPRTALYAPALFVSPHRVPACQNVDCNRLHVIKVPGGAMLRGCKKTKCKLMAHFQLRAGVHSQLRVIASLFVLRIFLTCLVGYPTLGYRSAPLPPAVQPPRALDAAPLPPLPPSAPSLEAAASQEASQPAASEPGPSTPLPAKRSKRTKAEPAAEPNKAQGKATKAKPAPQPGRWLDRDCNAALNMQRIGESRWRPLELCWWPDQGALPAKGKEYPGLGYKRLRDRPPKAQHQQPAVAQ
ncbi:hypothetical protein QJQ45_020909 [Haematococcus lacustris]|nr:hypothetical protein QJQ45_020909 [Haematococcus lacustris]